MKEVIRLRFSLPNNSYESKNWFKDHGIELALCIFLVLVMSVFAVKCYNYTQWVNYKLEQIPDSHLQSYNPEGSSYIDYRNYGDVEKSIK